MVFCPKLTTLTPRRICSFGRDQTCAMLLGIASGNSFLDNGIPLGIEPGVGNTSTVSSDIAALAKQAFYDLGERPVWSEHTVAATGKHGCLVQSHCDDILSGAISGSPIFSGRREGLALYFARLVRPFWRANLTRAGYIKNGPVC
jgi:nuclear pore complex protein Nup155